MQYAIGIDFGTESGRVMLVRTSDGEEAAYSVVPYTHGVMDRHLPGGISLPDEWALQHPLDYLQVLERGVPEVLEQAGIQPEQVVGIGVDFTSCTMLPTLRDGTPLCLVESCAHEPHAWVKLWKHHAAQPEADHINGLGGEWLRVYGGRVSSEWMFPKILQVRDEAPAIYEKAERFVEAADWVVWQMTGQERRNECSAGYKGNWIKGEGFPPELADIAAEKLAPDYCPLGTKAGGLTPFMATSMGLLPGTPVAVGVIDAHAAVPGCGVVEPGTLVMIMGTSLCHMLIGRERRFVEGVAGVIEGGIVPEYWGYEAGQSAVGDLYAWFFRTFGVDPETVTEHAARLQPGESGLLALDWWAGSRSVLMDANLSGLLVGMTLSTTPADIYRALIEATAFGTYTIIRAFESEGVPIDRLMACGGLPQKSPLVTQIFADVTNRTIELPRTLQASGLGAAMYGAVAGGAFPGIREAASAMAGPVSARYEPSPRAHTIYERLYQECQRLHDYFGRGGNGVMHALRAIRAAG